RSGERKGVSLIWGVDPPARLETHMSTSTRAAQMIFLATLLSATRAGRFAALGFGGPETRPSPALASAPSEASITLSWRDNLLTLRSPRLPGGQLEVWYLEAFCRRGSTNRDWGETTIPFSTRLLAARDDGTELSLHTRIEPSAGMTVDVAHRIVSTPEEVDF